MESLSDAVNNEQLSKPIKKERSLTSKFELLTMCADKVCDFLNDPKSFAVNSSPSKRGKIQLSNVASAIFDGFRDVYLDLQEDFLTLV